MKNRRTSSHFYLSWDTDMLPWQMVTENSYEPRSRLRENYPLDHTHFKTHKSEILSESSQHQFNPRTAAYSGLKSHMCSERASESAQCSNKGEKSPSDTRQSSYTPLTARPLKL